MGCMSSTPGPSAAQQRPYAAPPGTNAGGGFQAIPDTFEVCLCADADCHVPAMFQRCNGVALHEYDGSATLESLTNEQNTAA